MTTTNYQSNNLDKLCTLVPNYEINRLLDYLHATENYPIYTLLTDEEANKIIEEYYSNYVGYYESLWEFGKEMFLEYNEIDEGMYHYIDFEEFANDLIKYQDYAYIDGYVYHCY